MVGVGASVGARLPAEAISLAAIKVDIVYKDIVRILGMYDFNLFFIDV
jgi:hypothetical protein